MGVSAGSDCLNAPLPHPAGWQWPTIPTFPRHSVDIWMGSWQAQNQDPDLKPGRSVEWPAVVCIEVFPMIAARGERFSTHEARRCGCYLTAGSSIWQADRRPSPSVIWRPATHPGLQPTRPWEFWRKFKKLVNFWKPTLEMCSANGWWHGQWTRQGTWNTWSWKP